MLPYISTQKDYARFHREAKSLLSETEQNRLHKKKFRKALKKMLMLEPDRVKLLLLACYAKTGRPALDPIVTLRSFVMMLHFGYTSVDNWVNEVKDDKALQYLIGDWHVPSVASHYDFINRLLRVKPHLDELYMKGKNSTANKNKYRKLHKGEKWENYDEGDTFILARSIGITPIVISTDLPAPSKTSLTSLLSGYLSRSSSKKISRSPEMEHRFIFAPTDMDTPWKILSISSTLIVTQLLMPISAGIQMKADIISDLRCSRSAFTLLKELTFPCSSLNAQLLSMMQSQ